MHFFQGGSPFVLGFGQALPREVKSARAEFGEKAVADLERINAFNLKGRIPGKSFMTSILKKIFILPFFAYVCILLYVFNFVPQHLISLAK